MKKTFMLILFSLLLFGCSTETMEVQEENSSLLSKGKPVDKESTRIVLLKPTIQNNNEVGRIMLEPIEYTGELPINDNGGLVDWDGDGFVDDLVIITHECYFPRTFAKTSVFIDGINEKVIHYNGQIGEILGFKDVDNDGDMDVIFYKGNPRRYNEGEEFSYYNVGLNVEGQYPLPLKDIIQSLEVVQTHNKPEWIKWDLSDYGYEATPFYVASNGVSTGTYGEWGLVGSSFGFKGGNTYTLRFANLDDNCGDILVDFTI